MRTVSHLGIEPGMRIADFGAGSGAYVLEIASRMAGSGHIYAVDVQRDLLLRTKREAHVRGYTHVETIWCDLERPNATKLAPKLLDMVLISNILFQVEMKDAVLAEAKRVLKQGGVLALIDWSESFGNLGPRKQDVVGKESALELAQGAGFVFEREFKPGAHHYGLIFRKGLVKERTDEKI